jgi:hypothetical protein
MRIRRGEEVGEKGRRKGAKERECEIRGGEEVGEKGGRKGAKEREWE